MHLARGLTIQHTGSNMTHYSQFMRIPKSLTNSLLAILLLAACGTLEPAQVTGTWTGEVTASGNDLSLTLIQTKATVTGSAMLGSLAFDVGGSVRGDNLNLVYSERDDTITLNGRVSGNNFSGIITANSSGRVDSSDFILERQLEPPE